LRTKIETEKRRNGETKKNEWVKGRVGECDSKMLLNEFGREETGNGEMEKQGNGETEKR
jgi:hypothetical protein